MQTARTTDLRQEDAALLTEVPLGFIIIVLAVLGGSDRSDSDDGTPTCRMYGRTATAGVQDVRGLTGFLYSEVSVTNMASSKKRDLRQRDAEPTGKRVRVTASVPANGGL
jgi:hypothetical protein